MSDTLRAQLDKLHEKTQEAVLKAQSLILIWPQRDNPNWTPPYHVKHREAYDRFDAARTLFTDDARRALIAARMPPDDIEGVHPETTTHDTGLWLAQRVLTTFNLSCGGPHVDPLPPLSWERLKRQLVREHAEAVRQLSAVPPMPPPTDPPVAPSTSDGGFPHHRRYLTAGMAHSVGSVWPRAERQLNEFFRCVEVANRKLGEHGSRLPDALVSWWVREWADAVPWHTNFGGYGVADIRALYQFGRRIDRELRLSESPADASRPSDVEFTCYDRALVRDDGHGRSRPEPLATFGYQAEDRAGFVPVPFPRTEADGHALSPRIGCDGFLHWAGFLASADPLTEDQLRELGHVGYSEVGRDGWCRATHGEQYGRIVVTILDRLRNAITHVSDALGNAVELIPRKGRFDDALSRVSVWLARANPSPPPGGPNAVRAERRAESLFPPPAPVRPDPVLQNFDRERFSPWELPPTQFVAEGQKSDRPAVKTLGDLLGVLRGFADLYRAMTFDILQDVTAPHYEARRDIQTNIVREGLASYPWFDPLRTRLRAEFGAEPSAASVNQFVTRLSQERTLTIAEVEALPVEEAVVCLVCPDLQANTEPFLPVWDRDARTLTFGEWAHTYVKSAPSQEQVLAAFEVAGWPRRVVRELPPNLAGVLRNMRRTLGEGCPLAFDGDGTGGVRWRERGTNPTCQTSSRVVP